MWFIYNLHVLVFLITRSHDLLMIINLFLGSLVWLALVFAKILPWLIILFCVNGDLFMLSFWCCCPKVLFFFFTIYFSDRRVLSHVNVGHFKIILITWLFRLWLILLIRGLSAWSGFFHLLHLLGLTRFHLLRCWREISILHDSVPPWLLTIFLHLLLLFQSFGLFKFRFP